MNVAVEMPPLRAQPSPYSETRIRRTASEMPPDDFFGATEPSAAGPRVEFISYDDLFTPEPETKCTIPALGIAPGPVHAFVASWGTGKSMTLIAAGVAVAASAPAWGVFTVHGGRWLHVDLEMGRRSIKRYVPRIITGIVGSDRDRLRGQINIAIKPTIEVLHAMTVDEIARLIDGHALATVDPFLRLVPGSLDENSSDVRRVLDAWGDASEKACVPVCFIHHDGKADLTGKKPRRDMGRGSSAINDALQSKFVLTRDEKDGPILVSHEKTRELPRAVDDFGLRIEDVEIDGDHRGALRVVHVDREELGIAGGDRAHVELLGRVRAYLRKHPDVPGVDALAGRLKARASSVRAVAKELEASGELVNLGTKQRPKLRIAEVPT